MPQAERIDVCVGLSILARESNGNDLCPVLKKVYIKQ